MDLYETNEHQNVTYTYRKHIFIISKFIPLDIVLSFIILIGAIILYPEPFLLFIIGLFTAEGIFMYFVYKRFTSMKLSIDESEIHFENYIKKVDIAFADILAISSRKMSNFGGWLTIVSHTGEKITLTVAMKDISDFTRRLHEYLVANERDDLADHKLLLKAYRVATFIDGDFRRTGYFGKTTIFYLTFAILLGVILPNFGFFYVALALFFTILIYLTGFIILEYEYFRRKLTKLMKDTKFEKVSIDEAYEKKIVHRVMLFGVIIHLVLTAIAIFL